MCTFQRRRYFTADACVQMVREHLLQTASEQAAEITAYCFMPDHLHVLAEGSTETADLISLATMFRNRSGTTYRRRSGGRLWQEGYFDRVLRNSEATYDVVRYIIANPVRAGLCHEAASYPYSGSSRYSLDDLTASVHWEPRSLG